MSGWDVGGLLVAFDAWVAGMVTIWLGVRVVEVLERVTKGGRKLPPGSSRAGVPHGNTPGSLQR